MSTSVMDSSEMPSVLVIDDDDVHRMIICRVAAKVGYVPVEASSYDQAVRFLRVRTFDCISLDLSLGERGGIEILRLIGELECTAPIIIISGSEADVRAQAVDTAQALHLNSYAPLPKPVNLTELRQSLTHIKLRTEAGLKVATNA
jgi:CheY-like chemotaxis protein